MISILLILPLSMMGADISGRVTDPQGKVVSGAAVKLLTLEGRTDGAGQYLIRNAPTGSYVLTASASGFAAVRKTVLLPAPLPVDLQFDQVVTEHYTILYRFALSLTRNESESLPDAADVLSVGHQGRAIAGRRETQVMAVHHALPGVSRRPPPRAAISAGGHQPGGTRVAGR